MNQSLAMYQVQEIEWEVIRRKKRIHEIDKLLQENEVVRTARQTVEQADETLQPLVKQLKDLELQLESTRTKHQEREATLFSGEITNPKELEDMQREVQSLKDWDAELEIRIAKTKPEVESAQTIFDESQAKLEETTAEVQSEQNEFTDEKKRLEKECKQLLKDRVEALSKVLPENQQLYASMRQPKHNRPLSPLNGQICSICGIEQTSTLVRQVRQGDDLVNCRNCGRILVLK